MALVSRYKTARSPYRVQVLDRTSEILQVLAARQGECSLMDLCSSLSLHKSTIHRLLMVLEQHRFVEKDAESGRYRLGVRLFELGSKAVSVVDLRKCCRPFVSRVHQETGETTHFCLFDQGELLYIEKMEPERSVRMACTIGARAPAYCTAVGKAILAALPEGEVESIIRKSGLNPMTKNTITTLAGLKANLAKIRARGYALDDEEKEDGLRCVGASVRDHSGLPIAAISVSAPAFRLTDAKIPVVAQFVMRAAGEISAKLGYALAPEQAVAMGAV
ncbi:MAG TPA: IclR family transcriptional regulator [Candidatus Sulfotelmatobacter sp.]|nr:IclR family transcriptional regulator [Candidatus Sulfotelmatobacter sp.]